MERKTNHFKLLKFAIVGCTLISIVLDQIFQTSPIIRPAHVFGQMKLFLRESVIVNNSQLAFG